MYKLVKDTAWDVASINSGHLETADTGNCGHPLHVDGSCLKLYRTVLGTPVMYKLVKDTAWDVASINSGHLETADTGILRAPLERK